MIQSKFSNTAYFYSVLVISFPVIVAYFVKKIISFVPGDFGWKMISFLVLAGILVLAVLIWGFFIEMNLRMSKFSLDDKKIVIKQLLGFGTKKQEDWEKLQGFVIKTFMTKGQTQEHLYLIKDNKSVAVMSSLYMKNYMEVRGKIAEHLEHLK